MMAPAGVAAAGVATAVAPGAAAMTVVSGPSRRGGNSRRRRRLTPSQKPTGLGSSMGLQRASKRGKATWMTAAGRRDWMTMKIRLFNKDEYEKHWAVRLGKLVVEANGDVVGAQWNASFNGEPPDSWDDNATYRPTYMQD